MIMNPNILNTICTYILDGMTEREACKLADFSYNELQNMKESSPSLRDSLEKKHIQFKHNHLKEIQNTKSEKNSQWLLEKLRPEEFGSKARSQDAPTVNIINAIVKEIQNENTSIATLTRGTKQIEENTNKGLKVHDILK